MGDTMVISDGQYYDTYIGHSKELEQIKFPNDVFYSEEYKKQQKQLQKQLTKKMQGIEFKFQENVGYSGIQEGGNIGIKGLYNYPKIQEYLEKLNAQEARFQGCWEKQGKQRI